MSTHKETRARQRAELVLICEALQVITGAEVVKAVKPPKIKGAWHYVFADGRTFKTSGAALVHARALLQPYGQEVRAQAVMAQIEAL